MDIFVSKAALETKISIWAVLNVTSKNITYSLHHFSIFSSLLWLSICTLRVDNIRSKNCYSPPPPPYADINIQKINAFWIYLCRKSYLIKLWNFYYLIAILLAFKWFHRWFISVRRLWIRTASSSLAPMGQRENVKQFQKQCKLINQKQKFYLLEKITV